MKLTKDISVKIVDDHGVDNSEIIVKGVSTGIIIKNTKELEEAIHFMDSLYVLFLTSGVTFEDTLTIALIDVERKNILDSLWIGQMYNTGTLTGFRILNDSTISFEFIRDIPWTLKVEQKNKLRLPISTKALVHKSFKINSHLSLR